jgi:PST family polysaccharide transporter
MNHRKLAFGAMLGVSVNIIKSVSLFLLLPVMAKLVGPTEYGLYSIALPAVMFVMVISDAGLGMSLSREKDDTSPVWSSAYILLLAISIVLASALVFYAWLLSGSLDDKRLVSVTAALSVSLLLSALTVVPAARLVRNSDVQTLAIVDFAAFLVGTTLALTLAILHYGVWSLVAQQVGGAFCRALLINLRAPLRMKFAFSMPDLRPHLALGGAVGFARLSDFGGRMVEMLILSRTSGSTLNGPFGFGNQVGKFACETVNNQIWGVMYIIGLHASQQELRDFYFRLTRVVAILVVFVAMLVSVSASDLVRLTMGPEWAKSAPLIAVYTPSFALVCIASIGSSLMYARGVARDPLILNLELVSLRILAILMLPLFGWEVMIYALGAVHVVNAAHSFRVIERRYKWGVGELVLWLFRPILAAAGAGLLYHVVLGHLNTSLATIALSGTLAGLAYVAMLTAMDFQRISTDIKAFYFLLKGKKNVAAASPAAE